MNAEARLAAFRRRLADSEADAFLVTSGPNMRYLTGFEGIFDDGMNAACLLTLQTARFYTDARYIEAAKASTAGLSVGRQMARPPVATIGLGAYTIGGVTPMRPSVGRLSGRTLYWRAQRARPVSASKAATAPAFVTTKTLPPATAGGLPCVGGRRLLPNHASGVRPISEFQSKAPVSADRHSR